MTKRNNASALTAFFCAICIFLGAVFATGVRADDEEYYYPSLYCNDEVWYKEDIFPLDLYYQTYYVPASIFSYFDGVTLTSNERFDTLLISSGKKYISFNINTDLAITSESDEIYAMTYTRDGERYVPAELVCEALGFSYEYKTANRIPLTAMRICDGNQKKDFDELVSTFARGDAPDTSEGTSPDTTAPPTVDVPDAKKLYFTFDSFSGKVTDDLIEILGAYGVKATFFMTTDEMQSGAESIVKLASAGHSVGLAFDTSGFEADCLLSFENQNDILMRLIKHESRFARICGETSVEDQMKKAEKAEYTVWGWDIEFKAGEVERSILEIETLASEKDALTLRFRADETAPAVLEAVLKYLKNTEYITKTLNDATNADKIK